MLKLIRDWLCWYFIPHGIVYAEESGQISWLQAFVRLLSGGVKRNPDGPPVLELAAWARFRPLIRYRCGICGVFFWGWRKRKICYKFSCYRRRDE